MWQRHWVIKGSSTYFQPVLNLGEYCDTYAANVSELFHFQLLLSIFVDLRSNVN